MIFIQFFTHRLYNGKPIKNDIGLIKLNEKLEFSGKHKHLQPICLPVPGLDIDINKCYASGFGKTTTSKN